MNGLESLAAAASILGEFDGNRKVTTVLHQNVKKTISSESMGDHQQEQLPKRKKYTRISPSQTKSLVNGIASSEAFNEEFFLREKLAQDNCIRGDPKIRRLSNYLTQPSRVWSTHEWFYCTLDRDYCNENEFKGCLQILNIDEVHSLTRTEWSAVRGVMSSCIGRPRRFSTSFLEGERQKLNEYRKKSRNVQRGMDFPDAREFPYQVFAPIKVGDTVTVHDHSTHMLRRGQVLTIKPTTTGEPLYRVQFPKAEVSSTLCWDLDLAVHGSPEIILCRRRPGDMEDMMVVAQRTRTDEALGSNDSHSYPLHHLPLPLPLHPSDMDEETHNQIRNITLLTQMLDRKERFVSALRSINQFTEEALYRNFLTTTLTPTTTSTSSSSATSTTSTVNNKIHTPIIDPIKMEYILDSACKRKATFAPQFRKQCAWVVTNICAADIAVETSLRLVRDAVIMQAYHEAKKSEPPPPPPSSSTLLPTHVIVNHQEEDDDVDREVSTAISLDDKLVRIERKKGIKIDDDFHVKERQEEEEEVEEEEEEEEAEEDEVVIGGTTISMVDNILQEWLALLPKAKSKIKSCLEAHQTKNSHWIESTPNNMKRGNHRSSSSSSSSSKHHIISEPSHKPFSGSSGLNSNMKRSYSATNGLTTSYEKSIEKHSNNGINSTSNISSLSSTGLLVDGRNNEQQQLSVELIEHCIAFLLLVRRLQKGLPDFDMHSLLQPPLVDEILPFTKNEGICSTQLISLLQRLTY